MTVIEAVNSSGWAIPPMVIFEGKVHLSTWYKDAELQKDWVIAVSENGWTTNELGMIWLKEVFNKHTQSRTIGRYRLLILDGHGSHISTEFGQYCTDNLIIPLCMPAHSSHLLQPLDVGCFSPLKHSYGRGVEAQMRLGINHIDKPEFLSIYQIARKEAMSSRNIKSGFTATGLVPYNPERVLSNLNVQIRTPTPPSAIDDLLVPWVTGTPHNIKELHQQAEAIEGFIKRRTHSPPSPTNQALTQLVKGCQMAMQNAALLTSENAQLRAANARQKRKRATKRTYIATGGVLTVAEGIHRVGNSNIEQQSAVDGRVEAVPSQPKRRAPPKCSICSSTEHNARTCQ